MLNESVAQAIRAALVDGRLPCAEAFRIASELGVKPAEVGQVADEMDIRISRCQLGLFGYGPKAEGKHRIVQPAADVPPQLRTEIEARLQEGQLTCAAIWGIAKRFDMTRLEVSGAVEAMGVKVRPCQLGCF